MPSVHHRPHNPTPKGGKPRGLCTQHSPCRSCRAEPPQKVPSFCSSQGGGSNQWDVGSTPRSPHPPPSKATPTGPHGGGGSWGHVGLWGRDKIWGWVDLGQSWRQWGGRGGGGGWGGDGGDRPVVSPFICPSVRPSVHPSVHLYVHPLVCPSRMSVRPSFHPSNSSFLC